MFKHKKDTLFYILWDKSKHKKDTLFYILWDKSKHKKDTLFYILWDKSKHKKDTLFYILWDKSSEILDYNGVKKYLKGKTVAMSTNDDNCYFFEGGGSLIFINKDNALESFHNLGGTTSLKITRFLNLGIVKEMEARDYLRSLTPFQLTVLIANLKSPHV